MVAHLQAAARIASRIVAIARPAVPLAAAPLNSSFMVALAGNAALYGAGASATAGSRPTPNFDRTERLSAPQPSQRRFWRTTPFEADAERARLRYAAGGSVNQFSAMLPKWKRLSLARIRRVDNAPSVSSGGPVY